MDRAAPGPLTVGPGPGRVCLCPGTIGGGGIGMVMLALAEGFRDMGLAVDLVLAGAEDPARLAGRALPAGVRLVPLGGRARAGLWPLVRHLRATRPGLVISARDHVNLLALAAHRLAGLGPASRLVWTFHTHRASERGRMTRTERLADALALRLIGWPDARVAVTARVAQDLAAAAGLAPGAIRVIDNPAWSAARRAQAAAPCAHPWLAGRAPGGRRPGAPVVLGVGRLVEQKDFPTLLAAFAALRAARPQARLILLGEGPDRAALAAQAAALGLGPDAFDMPGHVPDPLAYLARADLFVLSSRWEGQPLALIEAMGCGCPVVATDCPTGPAEILAAPGGGRLGPLVPPGDAAALAAAMGRVLDAPPDPGALRARATEFGLDRAAAAYLALAAA
jgi:glycosyltransferase involved in cell wall biosynthesis